MSKILLRTMPLEIGQFRGREIKLLRRAEGRSEGATARMMNSRRWQ